MPLANLALKFLLELAALIAAGVVGWQAWGLIGAVLAPGLVALVWGLYAAPKSTRRWPIGPRIVLEITVFAACFAALAVTGHPQAAAVLATLTAANLVGLTVCKQWEA